MAILRMLLIQRRAAVFLWSALVFFTFVCPLVSAQSTSKLPAIDVFGGYSYLRFESKTLGFSDQLNLNGGNVRGLLPYLYVGLGATLDISGYISGEVEGVNSIIGADDT